MPKNNPSGKNGVDHGTWPPEDVLRTSLFQYATEALKINDRLRRLQDEHGLHIKSGTLKKLHLKYDVPSVCKPPQPDYAAQLILNQVSTDTNGLNGAGYVKAALAMKGHLIPRATVCQVIYDNVPEAVDAHYPGQKQIKRTQLTSFGAFAEVCGDGHDKGNALGLQLGPVSLQLYGFRCKWSGAVLYMVVVPNDRLAATIGHVFLDFVEMYQAVPLKLVVDKGSETGEMFAMQTSLRHNYAPDVDEATHPLFAALKSVKNTTIEGVWHWLRKTAERNFLDEVQRGHNDGIFNPNDELHVSLFNWIWPPICQTVLDEFVEYWNCHPIRSQRSKLMPSGATPTDIFTSPQAYGGERCSIPAPQDAIDSLRDDLPVSREDALHFVDDAFSIAAHDVWMSIGAPPQTVLNGWEIFRQMLPELANYNINIVHN